MSEFNQQNHNEEIEYKKENENEKQKKVESNLHKIQKGFIIATALLVGLIFFTLMVLIVVQFVSKSDDYKATAEIINTYTGIILGFVAMTVSLIGMVLSFYNTIQTEKNNLETFKEFKRVEHSVDNVKIIADNLTQNNRLLLENLKGLESVPSTMAEIQQFVREMKSEVNDIHKEQIRQSAFLMLRRTDKRKSEQDEFDDISDV